MSIHDRERRAEDRWIAWLSTVLQADNYSSNCLPRSRWNSALVMDRVDHLNVVITVGTFHKICYSKMLTTWPVFSMEEFPNLWKAPRSNVSKDFCLWKLIIIKGVWLIWQCEMTALLGSLCVALKYWRLLMGISDTMVISAS